MQRTGISTLALLRYLSHERCPANRRIEIRAARSALLCPQHQKVAANRIAFFELDVKDTPAVQKACVDFASCCGGHVSAFVHCAALFTSLSSSATTAQFEEAFQVNVLGAVSAVRALRPFMRSAGGAVVLISSTAATIAQRQRWTYAATKGALTALTKVREASSV